MVHRNPGDTSTLAPMEVPFSTTRAWVAAEQGEDDSGAGSGSFTRVVIGDLKPDVLRQLMDDEEGTRIGQVSVGGCNARPLSPPPPRRTTSRSLHVCAQELAHLYHYYLHGEQGNREGSGGGAREGRLPNGEAFPDIVLQYQVDASTVWRKRLAEVEDDLETRLLRAQRAELHFTLQAPDKVCVRARRAARFSPACASPHTITLA